MSVLGIDLGTTNSVVSVYDGKNYRVISSPKNGNITPSVVSFPQEGEPEVGKAAKALTAMNPKNTIYDVKRIIGKSIDDKVLKEDIKTFPFKVGSTEEGHPYIVVKENGKEKKYYPEEISAFVLKSLVKAARESLGDDSIEDVIITAPAKFGESQRRCTKKAGRKAGLNVRELLAEPIAAAIAYGLNTDDEEHTVLIFDLGGGTFDVTIIQVEDGIFDVISIDGDEHLGGEDFDRNLMNYFAEKFDKKNGTDILANPRAKMLLKKLCEETKIELSSQRKYYAVSECILDDYNFEEKITRSEFEDINKEYFDKLIPIVRKAIKNAREPITKDDITDIILVGGSSRIPYITKLLKKEFPYLEPLSRVHPDEAVSIGAAIKGWSDLHADEEDDDDDLYGITIMDACESSYGVETKDFKMVKLFKQNETIPGEKSHMFTTTQNYQQAVGILVFAGEAENTNENRFIGQINIPDIPRMRKGEPEIEVKFIITKERLLKVRAFVNGVEKTDDNDFFITDREAPPTEPQRKMLIKGPTSVDILFCIDATGSMGSWLNAAKNRTQEIARAARSEHPDIYFRFGVILYRDPVDCPSERNIVIDLTEDIDSIKERLEPEEADGGGDGPEDWVGCYNLALNNVSWDDDSCKAIIHIADAPAHGNSWGGHCSHQDQDPLLEPIMRRVAQRGIFFNGILIGSYPRESFEKSANIFKSEGAGSKISNFDDKNVSADDFLKDVTRELILTIVSK